MDWHIFDSREIRKMCLLDGIEKHSPIDFHVAIVLLSSLVRIVKRLISIKITTLGCWMMKTIVVPLISGRFQWKPSLQRGCKMSFKPLSPLQ